MELRIRRVCRRRSRVLEALLAAAVLLAACSTVPAKKPVPAPVLTLVPFVNDGSPDDAYLAAALTDEVRKRLSVILLRPPLKPHDFAVTGVLHATLNSLRLDVKLYKPGETAPFYTRSFERGREQLVTLQDEVVREIGAALHTKVASPRDLSDAEANSELARALIQKGALAEALEHAAKASYFDPGNSDFRYRLGVAHLYLGHYQQAVDLFNTVDPSANPLGWYYHDSWAHLELNHTTRVSYNLAEYGRVYGFDASGLISSMNAILQARFNNIPQAEMAIAQTVENGSDAANFTQVAFNIGCAYARMGRNAAAIEWLDRAVMAGFNCAPLLRTEPALRSLQSDPKFIRLRSSVL